jgi:apolipoprotein N-acyltransferase
MLRKVRHCTDLLACLFSGLLLAAPFNHGKLWACAWFAFVPLFLALNGKSSKETFPLFFITGLIFWSATVYWLVHVTLAGTIILVFYLALYFALFGLIIRPYTKNSSPYALIFIPSVWVLLEYFRGHLLTGFPWAFLGYSQYLNLPVIQIADITGSLGVSFLLIFTNVAIVEMIWSARTRRWPRLKITAAILILFLCAVLSYGYYRLRQAAGPRPQAAIKISLIQANIPQELKWDPHAQVGIVDKYLALTKLATQDKPGLIVWPEASLPVIPQEDPQLFEEVRYFTAQAGVPLLLGAVTADGSDYYNSAILLSASGNILGQYDKIHLVPFGEYIPLRKLLPFLETVVPIGDVARGKEQVLFKLDPGAADKGFKFGVLICFEDVFPELARALAQKGAGLLVNITNDGWYKQTPAAYQHLQASVLRAVENRVPVVRSANTGVSAFIGPSGKIVSTVRNDAGKEIFIAGYKAGIISVSPKVKSFYTAFGDIFILGCCIFVICGIIRRKRAGNV